MERQRGGFHTWRLLGPMVLLAGAGMSCRSEQGSEVAQPKAGQPALATANSPVDSEIDYTARGLPSPDRQWMPDDYTTAAKVLTEIAAKNKALLPRHEHVGRSGVVFARMVSAANFEILANKSLPLQQRMPIALNVLGGVKSVLMVYLDAAGSRRAFGDELLELQAHQLAAAIALMRVVEEYTSTLSPSDPKYAVRMGGLKKMKQGMGTMIDGALRTLSEKERYSDPQLVRFVGHLQALLPKLLRPLPASLRTETSRRVTELAAATTSPSLKAALNGLQRATAKATP